MANEDGGDDLTVIPLTGSKRSTIKTYWASSGEKYSDYYKEMLSRDPPTAVEPDSLQSIFGAPMMANMILSMKAAARSSVETTVSES